MPAPALTTRRPTVTTPNTHQSMLPLRTSRPMTSVPVSASIPATRAKTAPAHPR